MQTQTVNGLSAGLEAIASQMSAPADSAPDPIAALKAEIARLTAETAALRAGKAASGSFTLKVSEKGAVSVYGMGRFPVTLYREQWEKILLNAPKITTFIAANSKSLKVKGVE